MSFLYAGKGVVLILGKEQNMLVHCIATIVVVSTGLFFQITLTEWLFLTIAIAMVWLAEMLNTAIEIIVDLVSPEYNPLAGKAKDIAAAGVLISAITAIIIGTIIFSKYIYQYFFV